MSYMGTLKMAHLNYSHQWARMYILLKSFAGSVRPVQCSNLVWLPEPKYAGYKIHPAFDHVQSVTWKETNHLWKKLITTPTVTSWKHLLVTAVTNMNNGGFTHS